MVTDDNQHLVIVFCKGSKVSNWFSFFLNIFQGQYSWKYFDPQVLNEVHFKL